MNDRKLIIGTRGSDLALYQANFIKDLLTNEHNCDVELNIIKTTGDKIDYLSFDKMEGKGFFTKELEEALLSEEIDLAVHSLKDLMTTQPEGLALGAVGFRADKRELLIMNHDAYVEKEVLPLKDGAIIGTSSNRRKCQVAFYNPTLEIKDLRGNVPTRIKKLRDGQYDGILLAAAGVKRLKLDLSDLKVIELDADKFLPAPAQGILGIQIRQADTRVADIIAKLNNSNDANAAALERGLLAKYDSGCTLPLGVTSEKTEDGFQLKAILGVLENEQWVGLKKINVNGNDISKMVDEAFKGLEDSELCSDLA